MTTFICSSCEETFEADLFDEIICPHCGHNEDEDSDLEEEDDDNELPEDEEED